MKLAILHYHLGPGGVTRVIANHLAALAAAGVAIERVVLLFAGNDPDGNFDRLPFDVAMAKIDDLAYREAAGSGHDLASAIEAALASHEMSAVDTVIHTHNHSLGKNAAVPAAIRLLSERGWPLLLQIHDFAEDFRPDGFARITQAFGNDYAATLYPQASRTAYAVLNGRDRAILRSAGWPDDRLHFLPNPVSPPPPGSTDPYVRDAARRNLADQYGVDPDATFFLYPVRGIRRKNVSELLLAATAHAGGHTFGITLAPENPQEREHYRKLESLADELQLPVLLGTGDPDRLSFAENLAAADRIISTSVAEGFGMVFLEAWLSDTVLVGRDIPDITADFKDAGLKLDWLYDRMPIPLAAVNLDSQAEALAKRYCALATGYGFAPISTADARDELDRRTFDNTIDFADLDFEHQTSAIRSLVASGGGDALRSWFEAPPNTSNVVAANRQIVESRYSLTATGTRLQTVYSDLLSRESTSEQPVNGTAVLREFVSLQQFQPIRV